MILGALTHEMKTPVTAILGYADTLLHVRLSEEQRQKSLKYIYEAGHRMETMSGKLMSLLGMYENGAIEMCDISVLGLLKQRQKETEEMRRQKHLSLQIHCQEETWISGDQVLLLSLFTNLLQNSCRASEPGQEIEVSAYVSGENVTISVRDHGCGISEKDLDKVTKAFYMADKSRSRSEGGSGLGLAIAERIVALHGASWEICSTLGQGTCSSCEIYKRFTRS